MKVIKKLLAAVCLSLVMILGVPMVMPVSVQIMPVEAATKIKLNKKKATIYVGDSVQLKIKGTKSKAKWTSNKKSIAKVNSNGKVTGKKAGKAVITAEVGKKKYKCKITVIKPSKNDNISIPDKITIHVGEERKLLVKGTTKNVTWGVNNSKIVRVNNGSLLGLRNGKTVVWAKIGNKKLKCSVTVESIVDSIVLDKISGSVLLEKLNPEWKSSRDYNIGGAENPNPAGTDKTISDSNGVVRRIISTTTSNNRQFQLIATVTILGLDMREVEWSSSNPEIAVVDQNGGVTAVGFGSCNITASCGDKSASCLLSVKEFDDVVKINITKPETNVYTHTIHFVPGDDYDPFDKDPEVTFKVTYSYKYETVSPGYVGIQPIISYEVLNIVDFGSNKYYQASVVGDIGNEWPSASGPTVNYNIDNIYTVNWKVFGYFRKILSEFLQHDGNGQLKIGDKIMFRSLEYYKVDLDKKSIVNLNFNE